MRGAGSPLPKEMWNPWWVPLRLNSFQELDQDLVDLFGPLLLDPMAGARDYHFLFQIRCERTGRLVAAGSHFADHVMLTGDENSGLAQLGAVEEWRQLPIAIH